MAQFLKYILSILVLIVVSLYLMDFLYTNVFLYSSPRNKLQYILNTKNKQYDVVFMGSSRVANHINTKLFDSISNKKTINLGVEGAGLNDNLLQLKLLLGNNNKMSNVFLQIDSNFESITPSNIATAEAMPFIWNKIINKHIKKHFKNFKKLEFIPFYRYAINDPKIGFRELIFSLLKKKPRVNPSIGYTPYFGNKLPLFDAGLPIEIADNNIILDEIIDVCKNNNIQLTLFISPYCSININKIYIQKLLKKIPNLINLTQGYDDKLFVNCSHLNNQGANIFTANLYYATKEKFLK